MADTRNTEPVGTKVGYRKDNSVWAPLHRVTTVSKVTAAVVFVCLPFTGAYVGYQYGSLHSGEAHMDIHTQALTMNEYGHVQGATLAEASTPPDEEVYASLWSFELEQVVSESEVSNSEWTVFAVNQDSSQREEVGTFVGSCQIEEVTADFLQYRSELVPYVSDVQNVADRVYCGETQVATEIVLYSTDENPRVYEVAELILPGICAECEAKAGEVSILKTLGE